MLLIYTAGLKSARVPIKLGIVWQDKRYGNLNENLQHGYCAILFTWIACYFTYWQAISLSALLDTLHCLIRHTPLFLSRYTNKATNLISCAFWHTAQMPACHFTYYLLCSVSILHAHAFTFFLDLPWRVTKIKTDNVFIFQDNHSKSESTNLNICWVVNTDFTDSSYLII